MTFVEANKIIAEFMGVHIHLNYVWEQQFICVKEKNLVVSALYSESLDALVPVWKKLKFEPVFEMRPGKYVCGNLDPDCCFDPFCESRNSWQEAAAMVTAKAIQEIE